jgi:hypothetical protein
MRRSRPVTQVLDVMHYDEDAEGEHCCLLSEEQQDSKRQ